MVKFYNYLGVIFSSNGKFNKHADYVIPKAKGALACLRKALYQFDLPVEMLKRLFLVMIEPILLYGAPVWCREEKIVTRVDSVLNSWSREVLGVGRATPVCAVQMELGWSPTSIRVKQSQLMYYFSIKHCNTKHLQKKCVEFLKNNCQSNNWAKEVESIIENLELNHLRNEANAKEHKKQIKGKLRSFHEDTLMSSISERPSLLLLRGQKFFEKGSFYVNILPRAGRRVIARFKFGSYIWEAEKREDGTRICCLCNGSETPLHVLGDCLGLEEARNRVLESGPVLPSLYIEDNQRLDAIHQFLETFFSLRRERLGK